MKNQNKIDWIDTVRKQYHVDKLGRLVHAEIMLKEAEILYYYQ